MWSLGSCPVKLKTLYYGWVILCASFLVQALNLAAELTPSIFLKPLVSLLLYGSNWQKRKKQERYNGAAATYQIHSLDNRFTGMQMSHILPRPGDVVGSQNMVTIIPP